METIDERCNLFLSDLSTVPGVVSVVLYGSAVSGEYKEGTSDINLAVILENTNQTALDSISEYVEKWRKKQISTPLVITEKELKRSTDAFPIELFSIKQNHKLLKGKDLFSKLKISKTLIRTQLEFELRSRLIRARELYVEQKRDMSKLKSLLVASLPSFSPLFTGLLYLKTKDIPKTKKEQINAVARLYEIDLKPFLDAYETKYTNKNVSNDEILSDVSSIISITEKLIEEID